MPLPESDGESVASPDATAKQQSTAKSKGGTYKLQISLSPKGRHRLEELQAFSEAESATQIVREALRLYDILADEVKQGRRIFTEHPETNERVEIRLF